MSKPTARSDGPGLISFARRVEMGMPDAVGTLATMLKVEIVHQLSTPGQGRYYAKRRAQGMGPETAQTQQRRTKFNRALSAAVRGINAGVRAVADVSKTKLRAMHRASKPGDPPAPDTGNLRRSAFVEREKTAFVVGVAAAYARALEFGTGRVRPRPFMRPAMRKIQQQTGVTFRREMAKFTQQYGGGR